MWCFFKFKKNHPHPEIKSAQLLELIEENESRKEKQTELHRQMELIKEKAQKEKENIKKHYEETLFPDKTIQVKGQQDSLNNFDKDDTAKFSKSRDSRVPTVSEKRSQKKGRRSMENNNDCQIEPDELELYSHIDSINKLKFTLAGNGRLKKYIYNLIY